MAVVVVAAVAVVEARTAVHRHAAVHRRAGARHLGAARAAVRGAGPHLTAAADQTLAGVEEQTKGDD